MVLPQNHFVQNELPQFIFIECWILDLHHLFCQTSTIPPLTGSWVNNIE